MISNPYGFTGSNLQVKMLGELCVDNNGIQTGPFGSQLHKRDYVLEGTPIITVEHLGDNRIIHKDKPRVTETDRERLSKYSMKAGDIIFSRVGSVDRRALVRKEEVGWLFSGRCLRVRPDQTKLDSKFLSYFFGHPAFKEYINRMAVGATMPSLNTKLLYEMPIVYPSLKEQRKIATILGSLDDKIELNKKMNEKLEGIARAMFKSWFVDFDPVWAKMEGREYALDDETMALFPDSFEDSELGEIPAGWVATNLGEVIEVHDSKRIPLSKRQRAERRGIYRYYGATGIMDYVDDYIFDGIYLLMAEDGSVMTESRKPVLQYVWGRFWVNNHAHVLQGKNGVSTEQIMLGLQHTNINPFVTGAVQAKLNQKNMRSIPYIHANEQINTRFCEIISPIFEFIRLNSDNSNTLVELRDTLLPKLISGEVRVPL